MNIYQDIYKKSLEEKQQLMDYEAWLHGQYQMASIGASLSKKCKYPDRPFGMKQENNAAMSEEDKFMLWIDAFNRKYEEKEEERPMSVIESEVT